MPVTPERTPLYVVDIGPTSAMAFDRAYDPKVKSHPRPTTYDSSSHGEIAARTQLARGDGPDSMILAVSTLHSFDSREVGDRCRLLICSPALSRLRHQNRYSGVGRVGAIWGAQRQLGLPAVSEGSDAFWQVPAEMVALALRGEVPTSEQMEVLRAYLDLRCAHFAACDPSGMLKASAEPGYLETSVGPNHVFVPFHLGRFFPDAELLNDVVGWARRVALIPSNPICISGSTTFLSVLKTVGDLDYCEYHLEDCALLAPSVASKVKPAPDLSLVEVKCGAKHHHPWAELETCVSKGQNEAGTGGSPIKLDFVSIGRLGLLPTTSLVLPVANNPEAGNAEKSFSYQEAVLSASTPPRTLLRPQSLARYLLWLIADARKWLSEDNEFTLSKRGPKALKRLLSAALLLGETALVEEVVNGLQVQAIKDVTIQSRVDELWEMLDRLPREIADVYSPLVYKAAGDVALETDQLQLAMLELLEIGRDVLEELDELLPVARGEA